MNKFVNGGHKEPMEVSASVEELLPIGQDARDASGHMTRELPDLIRRLLGLSLQGR